MYVSIYDLFYGLMLPSGNDAAYMLGENFGTLIYMKESILLFYKFKYI